MKRASQIRVRGRVSGGIPNRFPRFPSRWGDDEQPYQRFKADKTENRNPKATSTMEYLHVLEKR